MKVKKKSSKQNVKSVLGSDFTLFDNDLYITALGELKENKQYFTTTDKATIAQQLDIHYTTLYSYLNGEIGNKRIAKEIILFGIEHVQKNKRKEIAELRKTLEIREAAL